MDKGFAHFFELIRNKSNISQLLTVNKTDLRQKIGTLTREKLNLVISGIKLLVEPRNLN